jgi:hypothetical protein
MDAIEVAARLLVSPIRCLYAHLYRAGLLDIRGRQTSYGCHSFTGRPRCHQAYIRHAAEDNPN